MIAMLNTHSRYQSILCVYDWQSEEGYAWSWGHNYHGQCGIADGAKPIPGIDAPRRLCIERERDSADSASQTVASASASTESSSPSGSEPDLVPVRFVQCAAGFNHSLLLDDRGEVWVAGNAQRGQLGLPPQFVASLTNERCREFTPLRATLKRFAPPLEQSSASSASNQSASVADASESSEAGTATEAASTPATTAAHVTAPLPASPTAAQRAAAASMRFTGRATVSNPSGKTVPPSSFANSPAATSAAASKSSSASAKSPIPTTPSGSTPASSSSSPSTYLPVDSTLSLQRAEEESMVAFAAHNLPPVAQIGAGFAHSALRTVDGRVWMFGRATTGVLGIERHPLSAEEKVAAAQKQTQDEARAHAAQTDADSSAASASSSIKASLASVWSMFGSSSSSPSSTATPADTANTSTSVSEEPDESGYDSRGRPAAHRESLRWALSDQTVPRLVPALADVRVKQIAIGQHHNVALTECGQVRACPCACMRAPEWFALCVGVCMCNVFTRLSAFGASGLSLRFASSDLVFACPPFFIPLSIFHFPRHRISPGHHLGHVALWSVRAARHRAQAPVCRAVDRQPLPLQARIHAARTDRAARRRCSGCVPRGGRLLSDGHHHQLRLANDYFGKAFLFSASTRALTDLVESSIYFPYVFADDGRSFVFGPSTHEVSYPLSGHRVRRVAFGWKHALALVEDAADAEPQPNSASTVESTSQPSSSAPSQPSSTVL
jgi:hypothetical protein